MSANTWCEQQCEALCEDELKSAAVTKWESRMSLRQYFKPLLPDPRGSLSEVLTSAAIAPLCSHTCIRNFSYKLEIFSDDYASPKFIPHKILLTEI